MKSDPKMLDFAAYEAYMIKFLCRCCIFCLAGWMVPPIAEATKPMMPLSVEGCMIRGNFVPYADQKAKVIKPLPRWARKLAPKTIEGNEVILSWGGYSDTEVPRFLVRSSGGLKLKGPCEHARLPKRYNSNLGSAAKTRWQEK